MGTNCAPLVADLFLYGYERDFMDSLNHDNQADYPRETDSYKPFGFFLYPTIYFVLYVIFENLYRINMFKPS